MIIITILLFAYHVSMVNNKNLNGSILIDTNTVLLNKEKRSCTYHYEAQLLRYNVYLTVVDCSAVIPFYISKVWTIENQQLTCSHVLFAGIAGNSNHVMTRIHVELNWFPFGLPENPRMR